MGLKDGACWWGGGGDERFLTGAVREGVFFGEVFVDAMCEWGQMRHASGSEVGPDARDPAVLSQV